jgi:preprotein translocase subunit SecG
MGILGIVLLVFFIVIAVLLILIVLVQSEEGDSLGGIFAGGSGSAFGSQSGNVLTRTTTVLGALFLVVSLGLALLNRSPTGAGVEQAARTIETTETGDWFIPKENPLVDDSIQNETSSQSVTPDVSTDQAGDDQADSAE